MATCDRATPAQLDAVVRCMKEELELAREIRLLWAESEQYWIGFYRIKPKTGSWTGWSVRLWWCRARRNDAEW